MLSGRYPATTGIFEIGRTLRTTMPDITTLPQHFKNHGYHTRSLGKIYHVGIDDDASWTDSGMAQQAAAHQRRDSGGRGEVHRRCQGQGRSFRRRARAPACPRCPPSRRWTAATTTCSTATRRRTPSLSSASMRRIRSSPSSWPSVSRIRTCRGLRRRNTSTSTIRRNCRSRRTSSCPRAAGFRRDLRPGFPLVCRRAPGRVARTVQASMPARLPRRDQLRGCPGGPLAGRARRNGPCQEHHRRLLERPRLLHGRAHLVGREAQQLRRRHAQLPHHRHARAENRRPKRPTPSPNPWISPRRSRNSAACRKTRASRAAASSPCSTIRRRRSTKPPSVGIPRAATSGVAMRTDKWRFVEWTKTGEPPVWELYDSAAIPRMTSIWRLGPKTRNCWLLSVRNSAPVFPSRTSANLPPRQERNLPRNRPGQGDEPVLSQQAPERTSPLRWNRVRVPNSPSRRVRLAATTGSVLSLRFQTLEQEGKRDLPRSDEP